MVSDEQKMLKERLRAVLNYKRLTISKFVELISDRDDESKLDSKRVMLGRQLNQDSLVTYDTIFSFLNAFHDISADWLVMGYGDMLKAEHVGSRIYNTNCNNTVTQHDCQDSPVSIGKTPTQVIRNREIDDRDQKIAELTKRVEELERDKEMQRMLIDSLKSAYKK